jgi:hypothetical protein
MVLLVVGSVQQQCAWHDGNSQPKNIQKQQPIDSTQHGRSEGGGLWFDFDFACVCVCVCVFAFAFAFLLKT